MSGEHDPTGRAAHDPGSKLDAGKIRTWLCISGFATALQAVAEVTTRGAEKYTPNGWATVPDGIDRYMDAFARHAMSLGQGERHDSDTGCLHKAQMIWNLLASLELEMREARKFERHPGCAATGMNAEDVAELRRMTTPRKLVDYPVVFCAPQGWGKTARSVALMREFGCSVAGDMPHLVRDKLENGWLYLSSIQAARFDGQPFEPGKGTWHKQPVRIISRGWKMQADFDTGPPVKP